MNLFLLLFIFLFGLIIGSFLNCLIWRLCQGEGLGGRSYCPNCRCMISWYDNMPLVSFIILGGKCRHCHKRISWQYPAVELITAVLFVLSFVFNINSFFIGNFDNFLFQIFKFQSISNFQFSNFLTFNFLLLIFRSWFLISIMIIVFVIDLRWYLILDVVTLPACAAMIILNLLLGMNWQNLVISGIIGGSFFLIQFLISKGRWIGGGDIRLGMLMGFSLGWPNIITAILLAYFIGSLVGILLIIFGKKRWGSKLPLGVFLSTSTVITIFWGQKIIDWYLNLIGY